ncbi:hypothetical protein R3P38DRAFT_3168799 [Favolaschia claudopus]|uniref:Uncharacterized protein n=1 Tax=Favolaschia claudopus TaxID=2862362 RepID=A0AAW0E059_9AGAR
MCRAVVDGTACTCERYSPPTDPEAPPMCRECAHGESRHDVPSKSQRRKRKDRKREQDRKRERGRQQHHEVQDEETDQDDGEPKKKKKKASKPVSAPATSSSGKPSIQAIFNAHASADTKSICDLLPPTAAVNDFTAAAAKKEALTGFRPTQATQANGKRKSGPKTPKASSASIINEIVLLTDGVSSKYKLRGSVKAPSPQDVFMRGKHGCVARDVAINADWDHKQCTAEMANLFEQPFQAAGVKPNTADSVSWVVVGKSYQSLFVAEDKLQPTGACLLKYKHKTTEGSWRVYLALKKTVTPSTYRSWYEAPPQEAATSEADMSVISEVDINDNDKSTDDDIVDWSRRGGSDSSDDSDSDSHSDTPAPSPTQRCSKRKYVETRSDAEDSEDEDAKRIKRQKLTAEKGKAVVRRTTPVASTSYIGGRVDADYNAFRDLIERAQNLDRVTPPARFVTGYKSEYINPWKSLYNIPRL